MQPPDTHSTWAVEIGHLVKRFGDFVAVDHVSLRVKPGEIFGFLGPNGAGKSTTIRILCGLLAPTSGSIVFDGMDLAATTGRELRTMRRNLQMVFSDPGAALDPRQSVAAAIGEPGGCAGNPNPEPLGLGVPQSVWAGLLDLAIRGSYREPAGTARSLFAEWQVSHLRVFVNTRPTRDGHAHSVQRSILRC